MNHNLMYSDIIQKSQLVRNSTEPFCLFTSVHKDISERLPQFNRALYLQVKEVL